MVERTMVERTMVDPADVDPAVVNPTEVDPVMIDSEVIDPAIIDPVMVETTAVLQLAVQQLQQVDVVALDTEFIRTDTFYPRLALVQLCDGTTTWLIDPLLFSAEELAPLVGLLVDERVIKVFHSCSEDLEVLRTALGALPTPLFDTQVAAAFIGLGFSLSYQALVKEIAGTVLKKHETRSDWLRRPLSESQIRYAVEDVHYLGAIYAKLNEQLTSCGRLGWLQEDMKALLAGAEQEVPVEQYYLRVKGAWKLDRQSLAILRALCTWRELEARKLDRPRGWIVADKELLQIAIKQPRDRQLLSSGMSEISGKKSSGARSRGGDGIHPRVVRTYGDKLVTLVEEGLSTDLALLPTLLPKPVPKEQGGTLKTCKKIVQDKARALTMAPEMLARKTDLTYLLHTAVAGEAKLPPTMENSWRKTIIGNELLSYVSNLDLGGAGKSE
ncbi:MAG: ribonuclease D [Gammaproteobacteria bacterium]|nr:MAG: ribonuclease D [Gammaproteobacteria bacterium]